MKILDACHDSHVSQQFPCYNKYYMMRIMYELNAAAAMKILSEIFS